MKAKKILFFLSVCALTPYASIAADQQQTDTEVELYKGGLRKIDIGLKTASINALCYWLSDMPEPTHLCSPDMPLPTSTTPGLINGLSSVGVVMGLLFAGVGTVEVSKDVATQTYEGFSLLYNRMNLFKRSRD